MKKYELTDETDNFAGITLHRIKALKDFGLVKKGDLGGFVESEENLSQTGNAWVYGNALVYGNAWVYGNALVYGNAKVYGNAWVSGNALVLGNARVSGNAQVSGSATVYGDAQVSGSAHIFNEYGYLCLSPIGSENGIFTAYRTKDGGIECNRGCFEGSLDEFESQVKFVHGDSKHGKAYRTVIELVRLRLED